MQTMKCGAGEIQYVKFGPVTCRRYVGKFKNKNLQSKAETGLWYTFVEGQPFSVEGEGGTPEMAISDAISRNEERGRAYHVAADTLRSAGMGGRSFVPAKGFK